MLITEHKIMLNLLVFIRYLLTLLVYWVVLSTQYSVTSLDGIAGTDYFKKHIALGAWQQVGSRRKSGVTSWT